MAHSHLGTQRALPGATCLARISLVKSAEFLNVLFLYG